MNIYDYAMEMERDGEAFYLKMAAESKDKGLKNIFKLLASQEQRHYLFFKALKEKETVQVEETSFFDELKNIFRKMEKNNKKFNLTLPQNEVYRQAQALEKKTENFYRKIAKKFAKETQKKMILRIADEENQHYLLLEDLIEFISRPKIWLENAEWNHQEEY
ncbi:MAG: ferritin family protein [Candidatus Aureabacteria bacterium]|nr:ferritin family protein [Candidatus Auribacterota bacterium]